MSQLTPPPAPSRRDSSIRRRQTSQLPKLLVLACGCLALLFIAPSCSSLAVAEGTSARQVFVSGLAPAADRLVQTPQVSRGCAKRPPFAPGLTRQENMLSGGRLRAYWLHIPFGYRQTREYPLVLNFHGHGSMALHQERYTGFSALANQYHFLVAYPQGVVGPDGATGWASGGPGKPQINDTLFVSDLLNKLQSEVCVDPRRIYATGFSNGGGMTSMLACRLARRIAAFASVSGSYFPLAGGCAPGRSTPILEFHGTADRVVPFVGRSSQHELGALVWIRAWARRDGCAPTPHRRRINAGVMELVWSGCRNGAQVEQYQLAGGIHAWPGGNGQPFAPRVDRILPASAIIWRFFAQHPLPPASLKALPRTARTPPAQSKPLVAEDASRRSDVE